MRKVSVVLSVVVLLLLACAPSQAPAPAPVGPPAIEKVSTAQKAPIAPVSTAPRAAWEETWEKALAAGKKEGKLLIYGSAGTVVHRPLASAFQEQYGIKIEAMAAMHSEIAERVKREQRAGIYEVDVLLMGATTLVTAVKPAGALAPLEPLLLWPGVIDAKVWLDSKLPWIDKDHLILAFGLSPTTSWVVNTEQVKPEEVRSYRDLLNPKWKGKMSLHDPTIAGAGQAWFTGVGEYIMGFDYMRQIVKQEPTLVRDYRLQAEWVVRGKNPIAIAPGFPPITEFQKLGAPISWVIPLEGNTLTAGHGTLAFVRGAPHPNAATVFINWLLSKEALTIWSKAIGSQAARVDVPTDFLDSAMVRQPGTKYTNTANEEFFLKRLEHSKIIAEIIGPLLQK